MTDVVLEKPVQYVDPVELVINQCLQVLVANEMDEEITIAGNGCSAFECAPLARWTLMTFGWREEQIDSLVTSMLEEQGDW